MKKTLTVSISALAVMGSAAFGQNQDAINETRQVVSEWVEVTTRAAQRENQWEREKELIQDRIEVLKEERSALQEEIDQYETNQSDASEMRSDLAGQEEELRQSLAIVNTNVGNFENAIREIYPYFPEDLKSRTQRLYDGLPKEDAKDKGSSTNRMTLVLGILNEFDKYNKQINTGSRTMEFDGTRMTVTTLYLGAGIGFYANESGEYAGILVPAKDGWETVAKNDAAPQIARLIGVMKKNVNPAEYVNVPAQLTDIKAGNQ